jgi:hypothetical protein
MRGGEDRDRPSLSSKGVLRSETVRFRYRGADRKDDRSPAGQFAEVDLALRDGRPDNSVGSPTNPFVRPKRFAPQGWGPNALHEGRCELHGRLLPPAAMARPPLLNPLSAGRLRRPQTRRRSSKDSSRPAVAWPRHDLAAQKYTDQLIEERGNSVAQEYIIHTAALGLALDIALKRVAELSGNNARLNFESVRDEAIDLLKRYDISPDPGMGRVMIVGHAIEMLRELFEVSLESMSSSQTILGATSESIPLKRE